MTEELLRRLYYDDAGWGLDTVRSLHRRTKAEDSNITLANVKAFLQDEAKSQRQTKRPRQRNSYVAFGAKQEFQIDIAEMAALMPEGSGSNPRVQRALEQLNPFRDSLILGQVGTFLSRQEGWALAKSQARVGTLRRALEFMGFSMETGKQGGISRVFEDRKSGHSEPVSPMALVAIDVFSKMASVQLIMSKRPADTAEALDDSC
jgi:hypothetical protein